MPMQSQQQSQSLPSPFPYQGLPGREDEYLRQLGRAENPWLPLGRHLGELGPEGLARAWKRGEEMLRENGIAHNLFPGTPATERRWDLDPLPLILPYREWEELSRGLIQRARVLNCLLQDAYGGQETLRNGLLPPALLHAHPHYHHPLRGLPDPEKPLLHHYAADLARDASGRWTVIADRTEAPNGTGFALENRIVLSNVFPDTAKESNLIRLAGYFQKLSGTLQGLAPAGVENPKTVLLTPGHGDRAYFEDAFLTRYLGLTLATGGELTVRGDRLYLKTVRGLQRVHVLIRRIPGHHSDPLETPTRAITGIPGLTQAIRAGSVVVLNPPGTGLLEAPAFLPYLPAAARHFLGEELLLPSIETHWGEDAARAFESLEHAVVKNAHVRHRQAPVLSRGMDAGRRAELGREIARAPQRYCVQREMDFSTSPCWVEGRIEARPVALRLFLYADEHGYHVMPGGLVRSASQPDGLPGLSPSRHTFTKDLWIPAPEHQENPQLTNLPVRISTRRRSGALSSQAADNMLWIGRYSERAEFATRVILEAVLAATTEQETPDIPALPPLLATLAKFDYLSARDAKNLARRSDRPQLCASLGQLFFHREEPPAPPLDSIPQNLSRLHHLASYARDRLSNETWRIIQKLEKLTHAPAPGSLLELRPHLQRAILLQSSFNGTCRENLTRSESWRFLNIGRRLERSAWLCTLGTEILAKPSPAILDSALSITDSTLTYRFRYQGAPQPLPALDLLLADPDNPRSLRYQLADLEESFRDLPPPADDRTPRPPHRAILKALNFLQTELLDAPDEESEAALLGKVRAYLDELAETLPQVAEQLTWEFFTHATYTQS
ncbi:MAG: circularly permuted type 2 ATP-grasp protein [Verrucomicrobiales bacterium]